jgi:hypothetical protein
MATGDGDVSTFEKQMETIRKYNEDTAKYNRETARYLQAIATNLGGYTGNEGKSIEEEVNMNVAKYLCKKFPQYSIFRPQWNKLKKYKIADYQKSVANDKKFITEFDGLYILTNDAEYYVSEPVKQRKVDVQVLNPTKQFVVVEAKHDLDNTKINKKIMQLKEFQQYLIAARDYNKDIHTQEFKEKIRNYSLTEFSSELKVIFASPHIPSTSIDYLCNNYEQWKEQGIDVSYMVPYGNRYGIAWGDTGFVRENIVNSQTIELGAKTGGTKSKARR